MPIVTDGLVGYWNSKQGVVGAVWNNIAPTTQGTLNGTIAGALVQIDGMYFDGVDDAVTFNTTLGLTGDYTVEAWVKPGVPPTSNGAIVGGDVLPSIVRYKGGSIKKFGIYAGTERDSTNTYVESVLHHVTFVVKNSIKIIEIHVNGVLDSSHNIISNTLWNYNSWAIGRRVGSAIYFYKGHIPVVRFYNRILTPAEITQNNAVSTEVGLTATTPTTPVVTQLNANKTKISDEVSVNQSIITVRFDTDVTQYVARLNGVDYNTGTLVHTGGAVLANTDAQVVIDWNELTTEGSNRINVYGQNANGWTIQT